MNMMSTVVPAPPNSNVGLRNVKHGTPHVTRAAVAVPVSRDASATLVHPLLHHRDFAVFWAGHALSVLGDAFAFIALPLLVLQATGLILQIGRRSAPRWLAPSACRRPWPCSAWAGGPWPPSTCLPRCTCVAWKN